MGLIDSGSDPPQRRGVARPTNSSTTTATPTSRAAEMVSTVGNVNRPGSSRLVMAPYLRVATATARPTSSCAQSHLFLASRESSNTVAAHSAGSRTKSIMASLTGPYPSALLRNAPGRKATASRASGHRTAGSQPHRLTQPMDDAKREDPRREPDRLDRQPRHQDRQSQVPAGGPERECQRIDPGDSVSNRRRGAATWREALRNPDGLRRTSHPSSSHELTATLSPNPSCYRFGAHRMSGRFGRLM